MASKIRQNYHEECEALINKQINMEFYASYVYLSMVRKITLDTLCNMWAEQTLGNYSFHIYKHQYMF